MNPLNAPTIAEWNTIWDNRLSTVELQVQGAIPMIGNVFTELMTYWGNNHPVAAIPNPAALVAVGPA
jgi:hypothetical protein